MAKKVEKRHVTVELTGNHTRGQMVNDHVGKETPNAYIIEQIDVEMFKQFMMWVCEHDVSDFQF